MRVRSALTLCAAPDKDKDGLCDLRILLEAPIAPPRAEAHFTADGFTLSWPIAGRFHYDGADLRISPTHGARPEFLQVPILGSVMSLILHYRGLLVLHAAVVDIDGRAAIFMGDKGAGKSTLAAALVRAGFRLLSDDIAALEIGEARASVRSGFAQIKLTASAAQAQPLASFGRQAPYLGELGKQQWIIEDAWADTSIEVGAIFVLKRARAAAIAPMAGVERFQALTRFGYAPRFGAEALNGGLGAHYFKQCAALANSARVGTLFVPDALDQLIEAEALIAEATRRRA